MEENQNQSGEARQISLQILWNEFKKKWWIVALITVIFTVMGGLFGKFYVKTTYSASSSLIVVPEQMGTGTGNNTELTFAVNLTYTFASVIPSSAVSRIAADKYNKKYPDAKISASQIMSGTTVTTDEKSFVIVVKYSSSNPNSHEILNFLVDSVLEYSNQTVTDEKGEETYNIRLLADKLRVMDYAERSSNDERSKVIKYLLIAFVLGLAVSAVILVLGVFINDTYTSKEELERDLSIEILAFIDNIDAKEGK